MYVCTCMYVCACHVCLCMCKFLYLFQVNIDSGDVGGLVKVLRRSSHSLCTSIKFGMFMKNLISGYPHVVG